MAKGISLHIGLNSVDPGHYEGWSGPLNACEADANDMYAIAASQEFKPSKLLTKEATRNAVLGGIKSAATKLGKGDIFFITYSGHGGQLPDQNGDEPDGRDETWCLYDGELVDDEIYVALGDFKAGVRVLMLSDSCHSGSIPKAAIVAKSHLPSSEVSYRAMPDDMALRTYLAHKKFYDKILKDKKIAKAEGRVKAPTILISGCQDNQLSADGTFNGLFTGTLKHVWNGGKFKGGYKKFHTSIVLKMPHDQTPNLFKVGPADAAFENQEPFTV